MSNIPRKTNTSSTSETTTSDSSSSKTKFKNEITQNNHKITGNPPTKQPKGKAERKEPIEEPKAIVKRSIQSSSSAIISSELIDIAKENIVDESPTNPFYYVDTAYEIARHLPDAKLFLTWRQVNKACKGTNLERLRLKLNPNDLRELKNEKIEFALTTGVKIKIKTLESSDEQEVEDLKFLTSFISNSTNQPLLNQIEAFEFGFVGAYNIQQIHELLAVLSNHNNKLPNLKVLIFDAIGGGNTQDWKMNLAISEISTLSSVICNELSIQSTLKISKLNNLTFVSCPNKMGDIIFKGDFPNLTNVSTNGNSRKKIIFIGECPKLISISCGNITSRPIIWPKKCDNLSIFQSRGIDGGTLKIPALPNLEVLDCGALSHGGELLFEGDLPKLRQISMNGCTYNADVTIPEFPNLTILNFGNIAGDTQVNFIGKFEKLANLTYGEISDPGILQKFQDLEADIKKRAALEKKED